MTRRTMAHGDRGRSGLRSFAARAVGAGWLLAAVGLGVLGVSPSSARAQDAAEGDAGTLSAPPADGSTPAPGAPADEGAAAPVSSEFMRELRSVESAVHGTKERVFRSKATLQLLRELIIESATLGSGVALWHRTDLPRAYDVESIQYFLDGRNVWAWSDPDGKQEPPDETQVRDQSVEPGAHTLLVAVVLRGNGGAFRYVDDISFRVESSYAFEVKAGRLTTLRVKLASKGGVRKGFTERPTIVYDERTDALPEAG
jgi:hypothetical protein